jgi:hypothetical protein
MLGPVLRDVAANLVIPWSKVTGRGDLVMRSRRPDQLDASAECP